jgi:SAM-dependent methyltransferase
VTPSRELAWDCGTGSGQAATGLAEHFAMVRATDPSVEQLAHAAAHPRVVYAVGRESESGLPDASAGLVTAAQAAHWFDLDAFYAEARRVLAPGGVIAVWCYGAMQVDATVDPLLAWFYDERIGRYWPPERRLVDAAFTTLPFPFPSIEAPRFDMLATMSRDDLLGYVATWSAVARAREVEGTDPVAELAERLEPQWSRDAPPRVVRWPLGIRVGQAG